MAAKPQIDPYDHRRPLAIPSPPFPSSPFPSSPTKRFLQTHRLALWLISLSGSAAVLLGFIILILSFTVFKVNDPQLTMNSLHINRLLFPGIGSSLANPFSLNATLTADISIKNPNAAAFMFRNSTTDFYYAGEVVGVAYAPAGKVRPRRTLRMNVTVDVLADRVVMDTNATGVVLGEGAVNITSFTDVSGRVDLLGIYKRDLDILLNCSFTLGVFENRLINRVCQGNVV
ncbi:uncharacterized protein LOC110019877 [Phalaenopsis equestris]|uniref:uncharacterized protein LOC110019877 n=1 Tax=Phalaenopsis equestris TaxID=78828 RepID=UPI0009E4A60D|nr:uncharacterized protein LOC110019877 [Phalaenopsis equestris]